MTGGGLAGGEWWREQGEWGMSGWRRGSYGQPRRTATKGSINWGDATGEYRPRWRPRQAPDDSNNARTEASTYRTGCDDEATLSVVGMKGEYVRRRPARSTEEEAEGGGREGWGWHIKLGESL